jgi:hypothetical protein
MGRGEGSFVVENGDGDAVPVEDGATAVTPGKAHELVDTEPGCAITSGG